MSHTNMAPELVESFSAYTEKFEEFHLEVWKRPLEASTKDGTGMQFGEVTRTSSGHVAYSKGQELYDIPDLGVTVVAYRYLG